MNQSYDAIIIGAGIIGSATSYALGRKGWRVLNIDRLPACGYGSTSGSCAIIRPYYSTIDGSAMAYESHFYWKLFSISYFIGLLIIAWDAKNDAILLLFPLNGLIVFLGLIGLTYNINFFTKTAWKIIYYFQFVIVALLSALYYSSLPFFTIEPLLDLNRFLILMMVVIFFLLMPIYGLWKYIYKSK